MKTLINIASIKPELNIIKDSQPVFRFMDGDLDLHTKTLMSFYAHILIHEDRLWLESDRGIAFVSASSRGWLKIKYLTGDRGATEWIKMQNRGIVDSIGNPRKFKYACVENDEPGAFDLPANVK